MSRDLKPNHSRYATLPPLSTGFSYGNLTVKIGHLLWFKKPTKAVLILCSWWGEKEVAVFEPDEVKRRSREIGAENIFTYDIKTNLKLFKTYLQDCETLEFVAIHKYFGTVVGCATVSNLPIIVYRNPFQSYFPIVDVSGLKLGEIHISFTLQHSELTSLSGVANTNKECVVGNICEKRPIGLSCDAYSISAGTFKQSNSVHENCGKKNSVNTLKPDLKTGCSFDSIKKDDMLVQILKQGKSLQDAMVRSILEDGDLLMLENTTLKKEKAFYKECGDSSSNSEFNNKIMDYLYGKDLSPKEESKVLSALCSVSPIDHLLEVADDLMKLNLSKDNMNGCNQGSGESADYYDVVHEVDYECKENYLGTRPENFIKKRDIKHSAQTSFDNTGTIFNHNAIDKVKACRISLHKLTIYSGKAINLMNVRTTYFIEFELPALLLSNSKGVLSNHQSISSPHKHRFCSRKVESNVVGFEQSSVFKLSSKKKISNERFKPLNLKFNIYSRNLTQKNPVQIGCADLLCGTLTSSKQQYEVNVTSNYSKNNETIGALSVSVEFISENDDKRQQSQYNLDKTKVIYHKPSDSSSNKMNSVTSFSSRGENSATASPCLVSNKTIERQSHSANVPPTSNSVQLSHDNNVSGRNDPQQEDGKTNKNTITQKKVLLHALLHISEGRGFGVISSYLKCRTFWKEDVSVSNVCWQTDTPQYNFYELIPVLLNDELLQRCQNNVMVTEVWGNDQLVGLAKLPLTPFYTAFRQPPIAEQLLQTKYPIISVDGWINVINPTSGVPVGQLNVLLALGTEDQVHMLEESRSLHNTKKNLALPDSFQASDVTCVINSEANTLKKCVSNNDMAPEQLHCPSSAQKQQDKVSNTELLSFANLPDVHKLENADISKSKGSISFLEEKGTVLNESPASLKNDSKNICNTFGTQNLTCSPPLLELVNSEQVTNRHAQKASLDSEDLREEIKQNTDYGQYQRAVGKHNISGSHLNCKSLLSELDFHNQSQSDSAAVNVCSKREQKGSSHRKCKSKKSNKCSGVSTQTELKHTSEKCFHAHVEIVNALNLPVKTNGKTTILPSSYVTLEVVNPNLPNNSNQILQTIVIWHSVNPVWEWKQDIWLSSEYLIDKNKRLIFKIWQKSEKPNKDTVIGFVPIDLTVLLYGMPWISGWFNISNFSGFCVGQIKVNISPLESLTRFTIQHLSEDNQKKNHFMACSSSGQSKMSLNKIESGQGCSMDSSNSTNTATADTADVSISFLSNALKRKLSELDEITQRLKQRLDSVTQEDVIATVDNPWLHEDDPLFKSLDNDYEPVPSTSKAGVPSSFNKGVNLKEFSEPETLKLVPSRLHVNNLSDHANSSFVQDLQEVIEKDGECASKSSVHECETLHNSGDNSLSLIESKLKDIDMDSSEGDNDNIYALTDYFMEMASQKFEIENVFNPLLFQHILRLPPNAHGNECENSTKQSSSNIHTNLSHSKRTPINHTIETTLSEDNAHRNSTMYWVGKPVTSQSSNNTEEKIQSFKAGELPVIDLQKEGFTSQETLDLSSHVSDGEDLNSSSSIFTERYVSSANSPHGSVSEMSYSNSSILEVPRLAPEGGNTVDGSSQNVNKCSSPKERKQN